MNFSWFLEGMEPQFPNMYTKICFCVEIYDDTQATWALKNVFGHVKSLSGENRTNIWHP